MLIPSTSESIADFFFADDYYRERFVVMLIVCASDVLTRIPTIRSYVSSGRCGSMENHVTLLIAPLISSSCDYRITTSRRYWIVAEPTDHGRHPRARIRADAGVCV